MSTSRVALVNAYDIVVNIAFAGDDYEPPEGLLAFPIPTGIPVSPGWTRDGGNWNPPVLPDPGEGQPQPTTLEELVAQMQLVITGQQDQLSLQQAQLDSLIDFIMSGM